MTIANLLKQMEVRERWRMPGTRKGQLVIKKKNRREER